MTLETTKSLTRLRLFNEKANELHKFSFVQKAFHKDAGVTLHFDFEKATVEANQVGADPEARSAMCLVLRFFLNKRDGIKLCDIAELYQTLPVTDEDKYWVCENLKLLNSFLDREMIISWNDKPITYRIVLDTILYGDHAHANEDKRIIVEKWRKLGPSYTLLENLFDDAAGGMIQYILWLAAMNVDAIKALEQTASASG